MKNKSRSFYLVLGLVGAFWFTGCCTYPGGMVAVYGRSSRPHHHHYKPAPVVVHHHVPVSHHYQHASLPHSFRGGPGRGHHR